MLEAIYIYVHICIFTNRICLWQNKILWDIEYGLYMIIGWLWSHTVIQNILGNNLNQLDVIIFSIA